MQAYRCRKKKLFKVRERDQVPSSVEGRERWSARLLAAINVSSFKASRDPHKERERAARQSYGKQKHSRGRVHYNTTSGPKRIRQPRKLLLCNSARAPLIYFLHNRVSSPKTRRSFDSLPAARKVVIIGRIRDNNTYVLCITVRESSRLRLYILR